MNMEKIRITEEGARAAVYELQRRIESKEELNFFFDLLESDPKIHVYLVGGIVRDALLGLRSDDFDFVVEGVSREYLENYLARKGKIAVSSDIQTAVFRFLPEGCNELVDIALPRREFYQLNGSRKPEVEIGDIGIEEDLSRRDFTINALAVDIAATGDEALVDPYNGVEDINNKIIRAVGDPDTRFNEDPLRLLRAIRFAARFGFQIEDKTLEAIRKNSESLQSTYQDSDGKTRFRVSRERIAKELSGALTASPERFLPLLDDCYLLDLLLPEVAALKGVDQPKEFHSEGDVYTHTQTVMSNLPHDAPLPLLFAGLLHDIGKPASKQELEGRISFHGHDKLSARMAEKILARYKYPRRVIDSVVWMVEKHMTLLTSFSQMKWSKQKQLLEHPDFPLLVELVKADAKSSIRPDGSVDLAFLDLVSAVVERHKNEKKKGKPKEIIDGLEIIEILMQLDPDFDQKTQGRIIGQIKNRVNEEYADGILKDKKSAIERVWQLAQETMG